MNTSTETDVLDEYAVIEESLPPVADRGEGAEPPPADEDEGDGREQQPADEDEQQPVEAEIDDDGAEEKGTRAGSCATVEEMGTVFRQGHEKESLRVRKLIQEHFRVHGISLTLPRFDSLRGFLRT